MLPMAWDLDIYQGSFHLVGKFNTFNIFYSEESRYSMNNINYKL